MLADKVPDLVNIITGAMVIGFFVGEPRFLSGLLIAGIAFWAAWLFRLVDWLARRRDRQSGRGHI